MILYILYYKLRPFQSLIVQLGPKECIVVATDTSSEGTILRKILHRSKILITERNKGLL